MMSQIGIFQQKRDDQVLCGRILSNTTVCLVEVRRKELSGSLAWQLAANWGGHQQKMITQQRVRLSMTQDLVHATGVNSLLWLLALGLVSSCADVMWGDVGTQIGLQWLSLLFAKANDEQLLLCSSLPTIAPLKRQSGAYISDVTAGRICATSSKMSKMSRSLGRFTIVHVIRWKSTR